ncbi:M56 family metallopeptidase [Frankia sp. CNm7]|uniref:M56 family metallopeptidase n=1 Tax=Frankia nepalensis TaxID=1836974 RepID=A0A937RP76_9ACTN|nr:M56 family metallopeptidase [Frankia nepalensis]MBL7495139.1 M56 family metallopeptidase [Frankia nepalensis]MBL7515574.1 M56 family metallopeptidase [Frankia nepalensis]MBL7524663.1 M56 family metallopeptidase [Frankia nepalensis]MBL7632389.1 M56 family metallopeptidase [Frankia nepalensis]
MIVAAALVTYAAVLAVVAPRLLREAAWSERAPRLAVCLWQALSLSVLAAAVLAGLALAVPSVPFNINLAEMLQACVVSLRDSYATASSASVAGSGLAVVAVLLIRVAFCATAGLLQSARARREHALKLAILARPAPALGAVILAHETAAAYCLPGRNRRIVLTTAALDALGEQELAAVLAHERAHLAGRHHLALAGADTLVRAFPAVPLFTVARREIGRLLELAADDAASRRHPRLSIATALTVLAAGGGEEVGLAAGGPTALGRVHRLLAPANPLGLVRTMAGGTLAVVLLLVPIAIAAGPLLGLGHTLYCPLPAVPPPAS